MRWDLAFGFWMPRCTDRRRRKEGRLAVGYGGDDMGGSACGGDIGWVEWTVGTEEEEEKYKSRGVGAVNSEECNGGLG